MGEWLIRQLADAKLTDSIKDEGIWRDG